MRMLRTLGPAWIAALTGTLLAGGLAAAALLLPLARLLPGTAPVASQEEAMTAREIFAALTAGEAARLREELRSLVPQLEGPGRTRLEDILAAEDSRIAEGAPTIVLSNFAARLEAAMAALRLAPNATGAAPGEAPALLSGGNPFGPPTSPMAGQLLLAAAGLGLGAALLALLAGPLALARQRNAAPPPDQHETPPDPEFAGLLREIGATLAGLRAEGAETARQLRGAATEGSRMALAAEAAQDRLDLAAASADRATVALAALPTPATDQAAMVDQLAAQLAQRLARVEDGPAAGVPAADLDRLIAATDHLAEIADRQEATAARLEELRLADATSHLAGIADRQEATAARLEGLLQELPTTAAQLAEGTADLRQETERLGQQAAVLPTLLAPLRKAAGLPDAVARLVALASDATERQGSAASRLDAVAAGLQDMVTGLPEQLAPLETAGTRLHEAAQALEAQTESLPGLLAPLATAAALPGAVARLAAMAGESASRQDAAANRLDAMADRLRDHSDQMGPLLDVLVEPLATGAAHQAAAAARLEASAADLARLIEAAAAQLEAGTAHLPTASAEIVSLTEVLRGETGELGAVMAEFRQQTGRLPQVLAPFAEAAAALPGATARLDAATARQADLLAEASGELRRAILACQPAPGPAETSAAPPPVAGLGPIGQPKTGEGTRSVAATILGDMERDEAPPLVAATLHGLDGLETEVARLLRAAEDMAAAEAGQPALPRPVAERAPELLLSLDATIGRLQSFATAFAMASDASLGTAYPAPMTAATGGPVPQPAPAPALIPRARQARRA